MFLASINISALNRNLLKKMIPKLHYISKATKTVQHLEQVQQACSSGIELIQLDLTYLSKTTMRELAIQAQEITAHFQTRLVLTGAVQLAHDIKADGIYLDSHHECPIAARKKLYSWQSIGAAAYSYTDCEILLKKEVDYIILQPFKANNTYTQQALGLNGIKAIVDTLNTQTPLLVCGGIMPDDVMEILATGISGIIVSSDITSNFKTIRQFHELLNASSTQEQRYTFK